MSKLKKLTKEDINLISDFFADTLESEVNKNISIKELEDIELNFLVNYENDQLDIDVDLNLSLDALSKIDNKLLDSAIDETYLKLDSFIDSNFRI